MLGGKEAKLTKNQCLHTTAIWITLPLAILCIGSFGLAQKDTHFSRRSLMDGETPRETSLSLQNASQTAPITPARRAAVSEGNGFHGGVFLQ